MDKYLIGGLFYLVIYLIILIEKKKEKELFELFFKEKFKDPIKVGDIIVECWLVRSNI
jgi:hypothetical protein